MSQIIFVRHAETDMAGRFCGHSDPGLNARGRAQLSRLIGQLRQAEFERIFASDLARARQTAEAIGDHFGLAVVCRPGLREIYFGDWEGLSWPEIEMRDPEQARRWVEEYPHFPAPGGETLERFRTRVRTEIEFLAQAAERSPAVVVTHAGFLRVAFERTRGIDLPTDYGALVQAESGELV
ncbi:MAG: histidine phosphatase family protein [Acidobacteria bacterium]|nr:histidine phosphatase family protein [Acidobacteriota bacterium]